jgi:predicted alpha/beta superfamily hydrolase
VWLPPGYRDAANSERLYPVLYMHDGQNCFDAATAAFGVEWGFDETAAALIEAGEIPPLVIVGIDNAGPARSREYNAPSADLGRLGAGGSSVEAIGDRYLDMLTRELMPRIEEAYRVMTGPRHTSLGGSSFGGNITLYAAMHHPGVFGRILVESPAVPAVGERFFEQIRTHGGAWPQRVFLAMGTEETANAVYNRELVDFMGDLAPVFRRAGLTETNHRLRVVIEDGAEHSEADWARRLPGALRFLYGENPRVAP